MGTREKKQNNSSSRSQYGFGLTLTDYLVVIGIVAVFAAVLFGVLGPARLDEAAEIRDLRRIEDLNNLSRAIILGLTEGELILVDTFDCEECTSHRGSSEVTGEGWIKFDQPDGKKGLANYLDQLPVDPLNFGEFYYSFVSEAETQSFKIYVPLESDEHEVRMRLDGGISSHYYEVGNNLSL